MIRKKNNSPKMREIRRSIDEVDSKILPLMVKRSKLVSKALDLKSKKSEIVDLKRINQIKKNVADQALAVTVIEQEEGRGGWQL